MNLLPKAGKTYGSLGQDRTKIRHIVLLVRICLIGLMIVVASLGSSPGRLLAQGEGGEFEITWNPVTGKSSFARGYASLAQLGLTDDISLDSLSQEHTFPTIGISGDRTSKMFSNQVAIDVLDRYSNLFGIEVPGEELEVVDVRTDSQGMSHISFRQMHQGVEVFGAVVKVHFSADGQGVVAISSGYVPGINLEDVKSVIDSAEAVKTAQRALNDGLVTRDPRLAVVPITGSPTGNSAYLAWLVELRDQSNTVRNLYVIDALNGNILSVRDRLYTILDRHTYDADHGYRLPGSLKRTDGMGGEITTDFGYGVDAAYALAVLDDGKILVGGVASSSIDGDFALARYNSDGTLDTSFGSGGKTTTDFGTGDDGSYALAVLDGGKILLGGYASNGTDDDFALARYNSDGTLDTSFGTGGKTTTDFGTGDDRSNALAVLDGGKILLGGYANSGIDNDFALARYNSDGTLDTSFGTGGKTTTDFGTGDDGSYALALSDGGKILVGGYAQTSEEPIDLDFALARYDSDGILDTTFGSGGKTTTDFGSGIFGYDLAYALAVLDDGKILAGGVASHGRGIDLDLDPNLDFDFALAFYDLDGTLHTTLGEGPTGDPDVDNAHDLAGEI